MRASLGFDSGTSPNGVSRGFYNFALTVCIHCCTASIAWGHPGIGDRIHQLDNAIASQPENQYLYIQRSLAHSENASPQKATQDIEFASTLGVAINTAFVRGVLFYRKGDFDAARHSFDQYLSAYPQHLESLEYRARLLRDAGQNEAAVDDFLRIFALNPTPNPGLYISTAELMVALPSYGIEAALSLLDAGMTKIGAIPQLQRFAIELEQHRINYPAAIQRMNMLPSALRETPQWKIELAQLYLLSNEPARTEALLDSAHSQLNSLPRNGIRDTARADLQHIRDQLVVRTAAEKRPPN